MKYVVILTSFMFFWGCKNNTDNSILSRPTNNSYYCTYKNKYSDNLKYIDSTTFNDKVIVGISYLKVRLAQSIFFVYDKANANLIFQTPIMEAPIDTQNIKVLVAGENKYFCYNTGDYYVGAEIFEKLFYYVDVSNKNVYQAHFINTAKHRQQLFFHKDIPSFLKTNLINELKESFKVISIVNKDVNLDDEL